MSVATVINRVEGKSTILVINRVRILGIRSHFRAKFFWECCLILCCLKTDEITEALKRLTSGSSSKVPQVDYNSRIAPLPKNRDQKVEAH